MTPGAQRVNPTPVAVFTGVALLIAIAAPHLAVQVLIVAMVGVAALGGFHVVRSVISRYAQAAGEPFRPVLPASTRLDRPELVNRLHLASELGHRYPHAAVTSPIPEIIRAAVSNRLAERHRLSLYRPDDIVEISRLVSPRLLMLCLHHTGRGRGRHADAAVTYSEIPALLDELEHFLS